MRWPRRLMPRSITTQMSGLVTISVLLGFVIVVAVLVLLFDPPSNPTFAVARVADATRLLRAASSPAEGDFLLAAFRRTGLEVEPIALSDLVPRGTDSPPFILRLALRQLALQPGVELLEGLRYPGSPRSQIVTKLDDARALMFDIAIDTNLSRFLLTRTAMVLMIVLVCVLLLSVYAVRWVISPLAEVATAAVAFGRSPKDHEILHRRGPREIMQVTDALNEMRMRIGGLLDDRTRMLAAISHDLRTPLTRLGLRAERVSEDNVRTGMQNDITHVTRMLDDTLEYLRDDARSEAVILVDLPSFLQTICSDFADTGHPVSYAGPARLSCACRPGALSRAVTNIVENAVKHGGTVTVGLSSRTPDQIEIEVADDGPGIPTALLNRVFEPFFKGNDARVQDNTGFGLGLSIARDIIRRHGGEIEMRLGKPTGLRVLLILPQKHLFSANGATP
jgi:signal transduction histidine kinase